MLPKKYRLRKNLEFRRIYRSSKSIANEFLVLYIKRNKLNQNTRVGFSISKKIGKANERNYLKRVFREIIKKNLALIEPQYDLIFLARQKIKGKSYKDVEESMESLLKKGKLLYDR
ncbi:MAG: ribonuclease P protein component [Bacillota bacterium]